MTRQSRSTHRLSCLPSLKIPTAPQVTGEAGLSLVAGMLAHRVGATVPEDYGFAGEVTSRGRVLSWVAPPTSTRGLNRQQLQNLYECGVRVLVVALSLAQAIAGLPVAAFNMMPDLRVIGVGNLEELLERVLADLC